jgi:hypothetical protein
MTKLHFGGTVGRVDRECKSGPFFYYENVAGLHQDFRFSRLAKPTIGHCPERARLDYR